MSLKHRMANIQLMMCWLPSWKVSYWSV